MKTTNFLVAAMCCFVITACNGNAPENGNNNSQNQELIDQLGDYVEGIGTIVDTQTLDDGTIVMTDEKRNTITQDKDGNITIQTKNGTTYIDNSIDENLNAAKDKWYNTTWVHGDNSNAPSIYPMDEVPIFFHHLETLGFQVDQEDVSQDKTDYDQYNYGESIIRFCTTTGSLQQKDTTVKYTYNRSYKYLKFTLYPGVVGNDEHKYELVIENNIARLYERIYRYDNSSGKYEPVSEGLIEELHRYEVQNGNTIYIPRGFETLNTTSEILSWTSVTTWFNYRRLNDTKIAVSNNTISYILEEDMETVIPSMKAYDKNGNKLMDFQLISF